MCWSRILAAFFLALLLMSASASAEKGDFVLVAGISLDDADGKAATVIGEVGVAKATWLSASIGRSAVDLPRFQEIETWYGDVGIDTYWEPAGARLSVAYWGDSKLLDSIDVRGSLYTRGKKGMVSMDFEYRDFELELPPIDSLPRTEIPFSARGLGLSGRLDLSRRVHLNLRGISYEYNVNLRSADAARIINLLSISRLSLLSSLIDWQLAAGIGINFGLKRWQFDVSKWRGAIDGGDNFAVTVSLLTPLTERTDLEIAIGYDDSDLYGQVAVLNLFLYFYGGGD